MEVSTVRVNTPMFHSIVSQIRRWRAISQRISGAIVMTSSLELSMSVRTSIHSRIVVSGLGILPIRQNQMQLSHSLEVRSKIIGWCQRWWNKYRNPHRVCGDFSWLHCAFLYYALTKSDWAANTRELMEERRKLTRTMRSRESPSQKYNQVQPRWHLSNQNRTEAHRIFISVCFLFFYGTSTYFSRYKELSGYYQSKTNR